MSDRRAKFNQTWTVIRDELLAHFKSEGMPEDAAEWYKLVRRLPSLVYNDETPCLIVE